MARIDDITVYNPFGWRIAALADPRCGSARRRELAEELRAWEVEELAHGYRHLTIEHGDPDQFGASRLLTTLYERVRVRATLADGARVRGTVGYVTVTVHGPAADDVIGDLTAVAEELNPGNWTITPTACPPGIVSA